MQHLLVKLELFTACIQTIIAMELIFTEFITLFAEFQNQSSVVEWYDLNGKYTSSFRSVAKITAWCELGLYPLCRLMIYFAQILVSPMRGLSFYV